MISSIIGLYREMKTTWLLLIDLTNFQSFCQK
uniref:Uncharacterized protein n=1 Tax=Arundo donax TaxID=35708 RepID=A0A0A9CL59_ARUDO